MEMVAALGMTSQITPSSISVNTGNGDHMGVAGDVRINFKIGRKFSFTHNFIVCERLSHPFIIGEDFMRKHVMVHCKNCPTCAKQRVQKTQFEKQIFEPGVQPMEFICIDLIGEFYPPSSKGNRYALTAVCMLTGFTFCIPIKNKTTQEVVTAWRNHISFPFGVCRKLLMDNGTEFKNELFSQVAEQLGVERKIYTPPYRPQSNGRIEGFHNFLNLVWQSTSLEIGNGMM